MRLSDVASLRGTAEYDILRQVRMGEMGVVFEAHDREKRGLRSRRTTGVVA